MPTFYCIRHGAYENPDRILHGRLPLPLSAIGLNQAEALAGYFADKDIRTIYSSAVLRCQQTSDIIASALGLEVENDRRLLEILTPLQGMTLEQYKRLPKGPYEFLEELGGETMLDVQLRMLGFFWEKVAHEKGNIIICSHGDPLYFLYCGLMRQDIPETSALYDREQYHSYGSVRPIRVQGPKTVLSAITVPHLIV